MIRVVLRESNNLVYFQGAYDVLNDEYINDATVKVTVYDVNGVEVTGVTWPLDLVYISGSNGDYVGSIDKDANLEVGEFYTAKLEFDGGPGRQLTETHELQIVDRLP